MKKQILLLFPVLLLCLGACNKQAIADLQARLDALEKTTLVSINAQIASVRNAVGSLETAQTQLREYIVALEAQGDSFSDIIESLQEKEARFSRDLKALQELVRQNAADARKWMEQADITLAKVAALEAQLNTLQAYLDSVESRLGGLESRTKALETALGKSRSEMQEIRASLEAMQEDMESIREQMDALVNAVQSVVVVPDDRDGSVGFSTAPSNRVFFEIQPLSAAGLLAKLGASAVSLNAVETDSGSKESFSLPVSATEFDGRYFIVTASGSRLPNTFSLEKLHLSARLLISDGAVTRSSEYFPLSYRMDFSDDAYTYVAEPVDLGLSVKWSAFNLGADSPEGYGAIYAWGETLMKSVYRWESYKWCEGVENTLNKYCTEAQYGTPDGKTTLEPEDDVAHVKLGSDWRMPTRAEMEELMNLCKWTWTADYENTGVTGFVVSSLVEGFEDASIFLPTAGYCGNVGPQYAGTNGSYWTSDLYNPVNPVFVYCLGFDFLGPVEGSGYRFHGRSVRPVLAQKQP